MAKTTIEKLRGMVDAGRLNRNAVEWLEEMDGDKVREYAQKLEEVADAIEATKDGIEEWAYAEDREERADAKESALEELEQLCNKLDYDVGEVELPDWLKEQIEQGTVEQIMERLS